MNPTETFRPPGPDVCLNEAARILGTDRTTVKSLIANGALEAYQLTPKAMRIRRESIIRLRERTLPPSMFGGAVA